MTYNVEFDNPDMAATVDAIATADADVVLLQEMTQRWQDALATRFATTYPHQHRSSQRARSGGLHDPVEAADQVARVLRFSDAGVVSSRSHDRHRAVR